MSPDTANLTDRVAFEQEWRSWHAEHEAAFAKEHGFLAVTGLHWLDETPQRFADAPGEWHTGTAGPVVVLADGEELLLDGEHTTGRHEFGVIPERGGIVATFGDAAVEVAKRGGYDIVRPRHPEHPLRTQFRGTPAYEPDPAWVLTGRYEKFAEPRPVTVGAAVEGLEHVYDAPGAVRFSVNDQDVALTVFDGRVPGSLFALFTDKTSGVTTYAANRALQIDAPDATGAVVIDFNRATNLPCAYTDFATFPLPPQENRLPVAVEAGEKIPYERW